MKVALVYDRVNKWGGAERVLLALHNLYPDAPLYTSVFNKDLAKWASGFRVIPSFLQSLIPRKSMHEFFAPLMPIAFEQFNFDEYDVVISVSSEAAKGIITKPHTVHINICLTPTRYLWSGRDEYFKNTFFKVITAPLVSYLRKWDLSASQRPDEYIAISKNVQKRIETYYGRSSTVIYPPLMMKRNSKIGESNKKKEYFLLVSRLSRLVPYKRVDLAIQVANKMNLPLKIIGGGRDFDYFKDQAGPSVEFLGWVTDEKLSYYYENCKALIFPGNEDFGLSMVEAQAHGAPVIAFKGGGALEIVKEGVTGEFFEEQSVSSLEATLKKFNENRYNRAQCIKNAERFDAKYFEKTFKEYISDILYEKGK